MMMPANFTAVNSEVVYGGADLFTILADTTAPIWGPANVKTFNTNIVTLVGNKFVGSVVNNTIGYIFHGNATWKGLGENLKGLFVAKNGQFGDSVAQTLGTVAAVYNLGNATVANKAGDVTLFKAADKKWNTKYKINADGTIQVWG